MKITPRKGRTSGEICRRIFTVFVFYVISYSFSYAVTAEEAYQAGMALYKEGQWAQSIIQFREAVGMDSNYWQAYQALGYAYAQAGDPRAALDATRISLQINPNNPTLQNYVDTKLRAQAVNAPSNVESPGGISAEQPILSKNRNSFYLQVGGSAPVSPSGFQYGWTTGIQFGAGYGFGLSRNFSLVLDGHFSSFPLDTSYLYGLYYPYNSSYVFTGGGIHIVTILVNAKFNFTDKDSPVVFYGIAGLGPGIFLEDPLNASGYPTSSYQYSEVDFALRFGLGIDIKLNPSLALTFESNGVELFGSQSLSYQETYAATLFSTGLKFDN